MIKEIGDFLKSDVGTTATAGVTITTGVMTNLGLISQYLGVLSMSIGIVACVLLARVHYLTGRYWQKKILLLNLDNNHHDS